MQGQHRFLILGASGTVGRRLYDLLGPTEAIATYSSTDIPGGVYFDATTMRLRDSILRGRHHIQAGFLLHGVTELDSCARDPCGTRRVNVDSVTTAIDDLVDAGVKPVFVSSDAVFDGSRGPWKEDDSPSPILTYGHQKLEVERHLMAKPEPWIIARLAKIVSSVSGEDDLLNDWSQRIESDEPIYCATDQFFSPVDIGDAVFALKRLAESPLAGIFNVCGPRSMSRLELLGTFIREIQRYRNFRPRVIPCSIRDLSLYEPRPHNLSMSPDKLFGALGTTFTDMEAVCKEFARNRYGPTNQRADSRRRLSSDSGT